MLKIGIANVTRINTNSGKTIPKATYFLRRSARASCFVSGTPSIMMGCVAFAMG
jgi:hypothetical protein